MHSFEVHSNESACRKSGRLGLEQVLGELYGKSTNEKYMEELTRASWKGRLGNYTYL